jgi:2-oxoglutarate dehydrogenase E2 component (dihydrolipoamide succinyltransferase)
VPSSPVRVPPLGESVVEATVGAWLKHEGDAVAAGETLVQLETEKVNVDVAAERAGVLGRIEHQEGDTVQPGDVLATLEDAAAPARPAPTPDTGAQTDTTQGVASGAAAPSAQPAPEAPPVAAPAPGVSGAEGAEPPRAAAGREPSAAAPPAAAPGSPPAEPDYDRPHASPVARRMAEENGLDLAQVPGTGTGGRVTRQDVERALLGARPDAAQPPAPTPAPMPTLAPADGRGEEHIRLSRRRLTIAQRLLEAQRTAAILTTFNEVDMSRVMELRARRRDAFKERHGVGLGFMSFFTKATVGALKAFPMLNAEIRGEEVVVKRYYDIGIAVGAEGGLVVPVVRDADRKTFAQLEQEIAALAEKARLNTLTLDDLRGGTFTITNGGVFGSLLSTPILSPPQVGILGMHKIQPRPVAVDDQVVIRPMMYLALSYDHRLVDGREAVQFLVRVKELVEDPETLLLDG